jgi:DNA-binding protein H-NS
MSTDLSKMSVAELKKLADEATSMISTRHQDEIRAGYEQVESIAAGLGLSVEELVAQGSDLVATRKPTTRKPVEPRYRNPANADETWTGRGKQPRWLAAKVAEGAQLADFLINK